jgi:CBS domain containing-hemolysin-like protein
VIDGLAVAHHLVFLRSSFSPFLNIYYILLFPLAKPTAMLLDWWLGVEGIAYLRERDIHWLIHRVNGSFVKQFSVGCWRWR